MLRSGLITLTKQYFTKFIIRDRRPKQFEFCQAELDDTRHVLPFRALNSTGAADDNAPREASHPIQTGLTLSHASASTRGMRVKWAYKAAAPDGQEHYAEGDRRIS